MKAGASGLGVGSVSPVCGWVTISSYCGTAAVVGLVTNHAVGQLIAQSGGGNILVALRMMQQQ